MNSTTKKTTKLNIIILKAHQTLFGLVVDQINDSQEIVVKPLSSHLKHLSLYCGSTIMGDGQIALILDAVGIAQQANIVFKEQQVEPEESALTTQRETTLSLLFSGPDNARMALPLSDIARLEKFNHQQVEQAGEMSLIQYGDKLLPLIYIAKVLPERRSTPRHSDLESTPDQHLNVIVYQKNNYHIGLVIDKVIDIIEDTLEVKLPPSRPGIIGSMVLKERVTELIDIEALIKLANIPVLLESQQSLTVKELTHV